MADFTKRVKKYEEVYEEVLDDEDDGRIAFIKVYNVGLKVVTRKCDGYVPSQVAFHLMNVHILPRKIWLSRHSENADQVYSTYKHP
jgi:6-phosphofructo-2-kinase / fructose-2,6-biphosphatase 2